MSQQDPGPACSAIFTTRLRRVKEQAGPAARRSTHSPRRHCPETGCSHVGIQMSLPTKGAVASGSQHTSSPVKTRRGGAVRAPETVPWRECDCAGRAGTGKAYVASGPTRPSGQHYGSRGWVRDLDRGFSPALPGHLCLASRPANVESQGRLSLSNFDRQ